MKKEKVPLSEYPRPQLKRDSYMTLNGLWEYAITSQEAFPHSFMGNVLVPFSIETQKEINHILQPNEFLYYRKSFKLDKDFNRGKVFLNFTAVDQIAKVWINNRYLGEHIGGFLPFSFDITKYIKENNVIIVQVKDVTDTSYYQRGKQKLHHGGIWYTPQSGIYLPVWLESTPKKYVHSLRLVPDIDNNIINIKINSDDTYDAKIILNNQTIDVKTNVNNKIKIDNVHLWDVNDPYLYEFDVLLGEDKISSYFGMRKISMKKDEKGINRIYLNNKPIFMSGVLDQGYYEQTLLTPKSDEDYINDIKLIKNLGFNCIRKHIKIETLRWYYYCDKLGVLVWQDFVNGGTKYKLSTISFPLITNIHLKDNKYSLFSRKDEIGRKYFIRDAIDTVSYLFNNPSIVLWTIFNEGWGQFDASELTSIIKGIDNTRLIDHASGWHDQKVSDVKSSHVYFKKYKLPKLEDNRAIVLSEFGGYSLPIEGHMQNEKTFGYKSFKDKNELTNAIVNLYDEQILPNIKKGLCASIYTQLSDVEEEINGLITFDRKIIKVNEKDIQDMNKRLYSEVNDEHI